MGSKCFNTPRGKMFQYPQTKICPRGQNVSITPDQNMPKWQNVSIPQYCILLGLTFIVVEVTLLHLHSASCQSRSCQGYTVTFVITFRVQNSNPQVGKRPFRLQWHRRIFKKSTWKVHIQICIVPSKWLLKELKVSIWLKICINRPFWHFV